MDMSYINTYMTLVQLVFVYFFAREQTGFPVLVDILQHLAVSCEISVATSDNQKCLWRTE